MNKLVCMAFTLLLVLSCTLTGTQSNGAAKSGAVNPENYPYFYVMSIRQAETDASSAIMVSGCFGDFKAAGDEAEPDLDVLGFDEEHPVELRLKDTCEVLLPEDFGDNIMTNLPCKDILQWYAAKNEGETDPLTFYAVLSLDESNQVTKLEYQYFPWG